jgi:hypothetical protein
MPTMTLLPDSTATADVEWAAIPIPITRYEALQTDNGDTSSVQCSVDGKRMILGFDNPSVAEGDIDFSAGISIRFVSSGRSTARRTASDVIIKFQTPFGFDETCSYDPHSSSYETINGTARTAKPDSSAWDYSDLEDLQMRCTKFATVEVTQHFLEQTFNG